MPQGKVLGVDIQPEMLELLQKAAKERGVTNVQPLPFKSGALNQRLVGAA